MGPHGLVPHAAQQSLAPRNDPRLASISRIALARSGAPLVAVALAIVLYGLGEWARRAWPACEIDGPRLLVWGFFISTVLLYHATYCVNSLAHLRGSRRFATADDSRNNLFVALITLGEGWHNNHHFCPSSVRQGLVWWEFDPTYYLLVTLERLGLVWDLRPVPPRVLRQIQTGRAP